TSGPAPGPSPGAAAGASCCAPCAASFTIGSQFTLTAVPAAGSTFTGWSGNGCSGTGTCTVTVNAATSVTATFTLRAYSKPAASGEGRGCPPGLAKQGRC